MRPCSRMLSVFAFPLLFSSCFAESSGAQPVAQPAAQPAAERRVFAAPASLPSGIVDAINSDPAAFLRDLEAVLAADTEKLLVLVDKNHALPADFVPDALVPLGAGRSYQVSRGGFSLTASAESALERMAQAAKRDGITLVVSSTYRSFDYQKTVYERIVREIGQAEADRESARPGTSQHQLGTAADFGSITDAFAETQAGKWLASHAHEYGWSLSFPNGYEQTTGYRWESWHYRYVGEQAAAFQRKWFLDIQQYMIEFIDGWKNSGAPSAD